MNTYIEPQVSFLVLEYRKEKETRACLESLARHVKIPHKVVLLDNGGAQDYIWKFYQEGLCDVVISKRVGRGGGFGQTDLFRWCDTPYAVFVQNDQELLYDIDERAFQTLIGLLEPGGLTNEPYHCVDLNGDQSNCGAWTDRAHLIKTDFFNGLGPFPNGGPGDDARPWNEAYLQRVFAERGYKIAHMKPALFADCGKWSVREAGGGIFKHRCDTKQMFVVRPPTYRSEIYPPFNDQEWSRALAGCWVDGAIPEAWKAHSFTHWRD